MLEPRFNLIIGTEATMSRLLEAIALAKKTIRMQFFAFEGDSVGKKIAEALVAKAKEGVKIEFMCDDCSNWKINDKWIFSFHTPATFFHLFKEWYATQQTKLYMQFNGILLKTTNPLNLFNLHSSLTARDHRKLVIIDDQAAFTGGFNISEHNYNWHDTFTEIHDGRIIEALAHVFLTKFKNKKQSKEPQQVSDTRLFHTTTALMKELSILIVNAKEKIYIESPYFFDKKIMKLLKQKQLAGVAVHVILPKTNNSKFIGRIHRRYRKRYPEIISLRVKPTTMLHAKHMLIDDNSIFGSSNFLSSKYIDNHEELTLITKDTGYNKMLTNYFTSSIKTQCI